MKLTYEILECVWPYLYKPNVHNKWDSTVSPYICAAIVKACEAGHIDHNEASAAIHVISTEVQKLSGPGPTCVYLITAAKETEQVPAYWTVRDPKYAEWRDQWLRKLIERERGKHEANA